MPVVSGVNLTGILGGRRVDPEGLIKVPRVWGYPFPPGEGSGEGVVCVRVLARKMLNLPPEVVIWWTLKTYFWEIVNTLLELWG